MNLQSDSISPEILSVPKLPLAGFIVFGLMTFWIYTVFGIYRQLDQHMQERWQELRPYFKDDENLLIFYRNGFKVPVLPFLGAGLLYCLSASLFAGQLYWYVNHVESISHEVTVGFIGLSAIMFYLATIVFLLSLSRIIRVHEITEGFLFRLVIGKSQISDLEVPVFRSTQWDRVHGRIAVFLVVLLPFVFLPSVLGYLLLADMLNGILETAIILIILIMGVFHFWGTAIIVGMFNDHVSHEDHHLLKLVQD